MNNSSQKETNRREGKVSPALLESLRSGDQQAFEAVYLRYMPSVKNFLAALVRSSEVGGELAQDVFVTLWTRRENIDPNNNISGYLYTIARNSALKYLQRRNDMPSRDLSLVDSSESTASPDEALVVREIEIIVEIAVSRMPAQRRRIYELSRKEGLSNAEIAELLNISKNTVENHVTSALKDLREALGLFLILLFLA